MKIKKIFVILLALILVESTQLSKNVVSAETVSEESLMEKSIYTVSNCPKCNATVIYSGCQYKFSGGVYTNFAGQVCVGCKQVVPKNERHITYYDRDRYFFNCTCGYSWYKDADAVISRHEVIDIN